MEQVMPGAKGAVIITTAVLMLLTLTCGEADSSPPARGAGMIVSVSSPSPGEEITGVYDFVIHAESEGQVVNYVSMQISPDNSTWKLAGIIEGANSENRFVISVNSTRYDDGDYYFRINVKDDSDNTTQFFLGPVSIWNPDPPEIVWNYPKSGDVLREQVEILVSCRDYDGELVDGIQLLISPLNGSMKYLGAVTEADLSGRYEYSLKTRNYPDGEYVLTANATTTYGLTSSRDSDVFTIDNEYAPEVSLDPISDAYSLKGTVVLSAGLFDIDGNVNSRGVEFFYSEEGSDAKVKIGNDPDPAGGYSVEWNTEEVRNGNYTIFAEAWDDGEPRQKGQDQAEVRVENLPEALTLENVGRKDDGWHVLLTMKRIPLAYPVEIGIFVASGGDYMKWSELALEGPLDLARPNIFELSIPVNRLPEGNISVRIDISDRYGFGDTIDRENLFYFFPMIPPRVTLIRPDGYPLSGTVWITAEVVDDENPLINPVYFHYSHDNSTWTLIGTGMFSSGRLYKVEWDTTGLEDHDHYHIRANYTDSTGISAESFLKDITIRNEEEQPSENESEPQKWYQKPKNLIMGIAGAVVIGVITALFLIVVRTAGKRIKRKREAEGRKRKDEERMKTLEKERRIRGREMDDLIRKKSVRDITGNQSPTSKPAGGVPLRSSERGLGGERTPAERSAPQLEDFEVKADIMPKPAPVQNIEGKDAGAEMIRPAHSGFPRETPERHLPESSAGPGYDIDCRCGDKIWIPAGEGYYNFKCGSCGRAGRVLR